MSKQNMPASGSLCRLSVWKFALQIENALAFRGLIGDGGQRSEFAQFLRTVVPHRQELGGRLYV